MFNFVLIYICVGIVFMALMMWGFYQEESFRGWGVVVLTAIILVIGWLPFLIKCFVAGGVRGIFFWWFSGLDKD